MDVLCLADIHGARDALLRIKEKAEADDLRDVLILGDFAGHAAFRNTKLSLDEIRFVLDALNSADFDVYCIPGNCDSIESLKLFDEYGVNLHERGVFLGKFFFIGFGGSAPTPFHTPFEMSEETIVDKLGSLLENAAGERVVVAAHNPPYGTKCDLAASGINVGSRAMRLMVEKFQPEVFLCSHIHESGGSVDSIGRTRIFNVGPLIHGRFGVLHLGDDIKVELSKI